MRINKKEKQDGKMTEPCGPLLTHLDVSQDNNRLATVFLRLCPNHFRQNQCFVDENIVGL